MVCVGCQPVRYLYVTKMQHIMTIQVENDKNKDKHVEFITRRPSAIAHNSHTLLSGHHENSDKADSQKNFHRILLMITLVFLALGLTMHVLPVPLFHCNCCDHFEVIDKMGNTGPMASCLVCLLLVGIFVPCLKQFNILTSTSYCNNQSCLTALEHHLEIDHPPILV